MQTSNKQEIFNRS